MRVAGRAASAFPLDRDAAYRAVCLNTAGEGFPRQVRLDRSRDYQRVFRSATVRGRHGALRLSAVANRMHTARLGLIVGKRALPRAHERNRARRVLRETFRRRRRGLPAMDIVVQVTGDASNGAYRASLEVLLSRIAGDGQENPEQ